MRTLNCGKQLRVGATVSVLTIIVAVHIFAQQKPQKPDLGKTSPSAKVVPLNIKPGLWETTINSNVDGGMPIPAGMLERLSPEQRARFEERMKANSAAHSRTATHTKCVTKEDIEKQKLDFASSKECTPTVITSTSTAAKGKLSCEMDEMKSTATFDVEAPDQEHLKGSSHGTISGSGHSMKIDTTFTSKWLGSSCGNER
jgi:hypothetical protein